MRDLTWSLQYVVNFPKGEKYVSLLRNAEDPEAQKVLEAERTRLRTKVQQQMADIAMITQADEGNPRLLKQPAQPVASPIPQQVGMQSQNLGKSHTCLIAGLCGLWCNNLLIAASKR